MSSYSSISSSVSNYVENPRKDFLRNRKLSVDKLISYSVGNANNVLSIISTSLGFQAWNPRESLFVPFSRDVPVNYYSVY